MERTWLIATFSILLFCLCGNSVQAQFYVEPKAEMGVEYYPKASRDFQAQTHGGGKIDLGYMFNRHSGVDVQLGLNMTRYLKNESKVDGSPLQTEATKVLQFKREAILSFKRILGWGKVLVGGWIGRRSIHWMDRDCNCYFNNFPHSGSAAEVLEEMQKKKKRLPGIAYHDGLRPYIKLHITSHDFTVEAIGPAYRWHAVTLPYNSWRVAVEYEYGNLTVGNRSKFGGLKEYSSDAYAYYSLIPEIAVGVHAGRISYPGYQRPLSRFSVSLEISLSRLHRW